MDDDLDLIDLEEHIEQRRSYAQPSTDICSLDILLTLYLRATNILYVDRMEGFKRLIWWLGRPPVSPIRYAKLHESIYNYEHQEIAKILGISIEEVFFTMLKIEGISLNETPTKCE
jgi:hypothetical protein